MGAIKKGILLLNTIKHLKFRQIINQITVRFKHKERFWNYEKKGIKYTDYDLWIDALDNNKTVFERFSPELLLNGQLTLLNESRLFDRWRFSDASHLWNYNVHYLEYLVPLASLWFLTGEEKYKTKLNEILEDWFIVGSKEADSNQPYTISLRIINQLVISEAVDNRQELYDSIYAQYRFLLKHQEKHLLGNHYLENLKAIVVCSIVFDEEEVYKRSIKLLLRELKEQVTKDGMHYELSIMYHKLVLEDLIRVATVLRKANKKEYSLIVQYIEKMSSALYSIEFGIGSTPLFNDSGNNVAKPTDALLRVCREQFCTNLQKKNSVSGYYKLYDGKITVIFDCGVLAPSYMPGHAHCDCLSFELYYDNEPLFVNSGTYQYQGEKRNFFRSTQAHNTVSINGHEQSELWGEHRAGRRLSRVNCVFRDGSVIGSYRNYLGETHRRDFWLDKGCFYVTDKTSGAGKSYLHIAPNVTFKENIIIWRNLEIRVLPVDSEMSFEKSYYAPEFGELLENECIVFSWSNDSKEHGYIIEIKEKNKDD